MNCTRWTEIVKRSSKKLNGFYIIYAVNFSIALSPNGIPVQIQRVIYQIFVFGMNLVPVAVIIKANLSLASSIIFWVGFPAP